MVKTKIICAVTNDLLNDRRMYRICSTMHKAGYDVILVGREKRNSTSIPNADFNTYRLKVKDESGPLFYYQYNKVLKDFLLQEKPDIVYAVDTDTLMGCGKAVAQLGCKFVYDSHEYFTEVPELEGKWVKKKIWQLIEKRYVPKTDARITVGEELSKMFESKWNLDFTVVKNVPLIRTDLDQQKNQNTRKLLYQGVLNKGRGVVEAIDALEFIEDKHMELHLVGGGDLTAELRAYAKSKTYGDRIIFHGWQTGAGLDGFARQAWLGLNLLETKSLNYKYSLANKFFDYMHAGLPSLNMELPEYQNIIKRYKVGQMIANLDPKTIANSINNITDEHYKVMIDKSREASKIYNWEADREVLLKTIGQLI